MLCERTVHCLLVGQWLTIINILHGLAGLVRSHFGYLLDSSSEVVLRLEIMVVRIVVAKCSLPAVQAFSL